LWTRGGFMTQILRTDVDQRPVSELAARFRGE
jgi:hypothetical protein